MERLCEEEWRGRREAHVAVVREYAEGFQDRRARREKHPVFDFLFTYYQYSPAQLMSWHPGVGVALELPKRRKFAPKEWLRDPYVEEDGWVWLDVRKMGAKQVYRVEWILELCRAVQGRGGHYGCFGLHEWAMVYAPEGGVRHEQYPLRMGDAELATFVESQSLRCTHYDAFRHFTEAARPMNLLEPTLEARQEMEQPGCVHVNMDLYKWAHKLAPWGGSDLVREAFLLALEARDLDMRASPYDLRALGYEAVRIETEEGRERYRREQAGIAKKGEEMRVKLVESCERVLEGREGLTKASTHH